MLSLDPSTLQMFGVKIHGMNEGVSECGCPTGPALCYLMHPVSSGEREGEALSRGPLSFHFLPSLPGERLR